jgi:hypothetical protein
MKKEVALQIIESEWEPILYGRADLSELLGLSQDEADTIVWEITGSPEEPGVAHHELVGYLSDIMTISQVPDHPAELPKQGLWLLDQGWRLNPTRSTFRWINPYTDQVISLSLRAALKVELRSLYIEGFKDVDSDDGDDTIDAEFHVMEDD